MKKLRIFTTVCALSFCFLSFTQGPAFYECTRFVIEEDGTEICYDCCLTSYESHSQRTACFNACDDALQ